MEWLACTDPGEMLAFLKRRASDRKRQLFAVACCRRAWHASADPRHREAVEAAERFADGRLGAADFEAILQPVVELWGDLPPHPEGGWGPSHYMTGATRHLVRGSSASYAASYAARGLACLEGAKGDPAWLAAQRAEEAVQCSLLRDVIGSPFKPFRFDPAWLAGDGEAAVALARQIDAEGRFGDLPALADRLAHAGCADDDVLAHCRGPGPHVRGCWVVDALLGRETAVHEGLTTAEDWLGCEDPTPLLHVLRDQGTERTWRLFAVACCRRIAPWITDERSRRAVDVAARYADGDATEAELEAARAAAQEAEKEAWSAEYSAEAEANFCVTPHFAAVSRRHFAARAARSAVCRDPRATDAEPGSFEAKRWHPSHFWAAAVVKWDVYAGMNDETEHWRSGPVVAAAEAAERAELRAHCEILRDLFGDHLGPTGVEGGWLPFENGSREAWCLRPSPVVARPRPEWMSWNGGLIPKLARAIHHREEFDSLPILADSLAAAGCTDSALLDHLLSPGPHYRGCWVLDRLMDRPDSE